jgi:formate dehydrogenase iron-sulfur subunit
MTTKIYVPRDSAAKAVGADEVAVAIAAEAAKRNISVQIIRNSSRGMAWLETFVEVDTPKGRVGYGPVEAADVTSLFAAGFHEGKTHKLGHGLVEALPYLKNQERLTFARAGITKCRVAQSLQKSRTLACADAAVRASPPASNGKLFTTPRQIKNISAATPTKATPEPSPTAW